MDTLASPASTARPVDRIVPGGWALLAHALSLDTVLAVVAAGWLVSVALGVPLPPRWWVVLGLSCWGVYLIDHLLDAGRMQPNVASRRRAPFVQSRGGWWLLAAIGLAVDLALATTLPRPLLVGGLALLLPLALHLALAQRASPIPKELTATLVYLLALWFAPLVMATQLPRWAGALAVAHAAAAFANLAATSCVDAASDRRERQRSLATRFGSDLARRATVVAATVGLLAAGWVAMDPTAPLGIAAAFAVASCVPAVILTWRGVAPELARAAADLTFLVVALCIAMAGP